MALKIASIQQLSGTTVTWDALYKFAKITAIGNVAITLSNVGTPDGGVLHFKQDATGGRTLSINTTTVTVDTASGTLTRIEWSYDGTDYVYTSSYGASSSSSNTPAAPTTAVVDDANNTFDWTNNPNYTTLTDYEYTLNGGATWLDVSAKPISVGNVYKAIGQVGVRVKAATGRNASAALYSTSDFSYASSEITWVQLTNTTAAAGGTLSLTTQTLPAGATASQRLGIDGSYIQMTVPSTITDSEACVLVFDDVNDSVYKWGGPTGGVTVLSSIFISGGMMYCAYGNTNNGPTNINTNIPAVAGDVWRMEKQGVNVLVKKNGMTIYTFSAALASATDVYIKAIFAATGATKKLYQVQGGGLS